MKAAIATLEIALEALKTNEPINRAAGNFEQADLEKENAAEIEEALLELRKVKIPWSLGGFHPENGADYIPPAELIDRGLTLLTEGISQSTTFAEDLMRFTPAATYFMAARDQIKAKEAEYY